MKKVIIRWKTTESATYENVRDYKIFDNNCTFNLKDGTKIIVPFDNVIYIKIEE